jgi:hypothetical protein
MNESWGKFCIIYDEIYLPGFVYDFIKPFPPFSNPFNWLKSSEKIRMAAQLIGKYVQDAN